MAHLLVKMVLQVAHIVHVGGIGCGEALYALGIVAVEAVGPLREVGRAEAVAQHTECRVWQQPAAVGLDEGLVVGARKRALAFLGEYLVEERYLTFVHPLVVNLRERVQILSECLVVGTALLVGERAKLLQAQIHGVKGEGGVGVVGVRVHPCVRHGGVVDGKNLHEALARGGSPVNHLLEVVEIAHAEIVVAAQGEYGDSHTGTLPVEGIAHTQAGKHRGLANGRIDAHRAVVAMLPCHHIARGTVEHHKLEFAGGGDVASVNEGAPLRIARIAHAHGLRRVPCAQRGRRAGYRQHLAGSHHRRLGLKKYLAGTGLHIGSRSLPLAHTLRERRGVERLVVGHVAPAVEHHTAMQRLRAVERVAFTPLAAHRVAVAHHNIMVRHRHFALGNIYMQRPSVAVAGRHRRSEIVAAGTEHLRAAAHLEAFTPLRVVVNMQCEHHGKESFTFL